MLPSILKHLRQDVQAKLKELAYANYANNVGKTNAKEYEEDFHPYSYIALDGMTDQQALAAVRHQHHLPHIIIKHGEKEKDKQPLGKENECFLACQLYPKLLNFSAPLLQKHVQALQTKHLGSKWSVIPLPLVYSITVPIEKAKDKVEQDAFVYTYGRWWAENAGNSLADCSFKPLMINLGQRQLKRLAEQQYKHPKHYSKECTLTDAAQLLYKNFTEARSYTAIVPLQGENPIQWLDADPRVLTFALLFSDLHSFFDRTSFDTVRVYSQIEGKKTLEADTFPALALSNKMQLLQERPFRLYETFLSKTCDELKKLPKVLPALELGVAKKILEIRKALPYDCELKKPFECSKSATWKTCDNNNVTIFESYKFVRVNKLAKGLAAPYALTVEQAAPQKEEFIKAVQGMYNEAYISASQRDHQRSRVQGTSDINMGNYVCWDDKLFNDTVFDVFCASENAVQLALEEEESKQEQADEREKKEDVQQQNKQEQSMDQSMVDKDDMKESTGVQSTTQTFEKAQPLAQPQKRGRRSGKRVIGSVLPDANDKQEQKESEHKDVPMEGPMQGSMVDKPASSIPYATDKDIFKLCKLEKMSLDVHKETKDFAVLCKTRIEMQRQFLNDYLVLPNGSKTTDEVIKREVMSWCYLFKGMNKEQEQAYRKEQLKEFPNDECLKSDPNYFPGKFYTTLIEKPLCLNNSDYQKVSTMVFYHAFGQRMLVNPHPWEHNGSTTVRYYMFYPFSLSHSVSPLVLNLNDETLRESKEQWWNTLGSFKKLIDVKFKMNLQSAYCYTNASGVK